MDACTLFLDMDSVIDRPECINDFHKLMHCAAGIPCLHCCSFTCSRRARLDGSDHRGCCTQWGVPRRCLEWCRGEPVASVELCALAYTKPIVACFHEGKGKKACFIHSLQLSPLDGVVCTDEQNITRPLQSAFPGHHETCASSRHSATRSKSPGTRRRRTPTRSSCTGCSGASRARSRRTRTTRNPRPSPSSASRRAPLTSWWSKRETGTVRVP